MNNFKNTYIKLKNSDKNVKRIKEIADKYSRASNCEVEFYLQPEDFESAWDYIIISHSNEVMVANSQRRVRDYKEITEEYLDNYLSDQLHDNRKKCCEGGELTAGCFHDNCTGAINMNKEEDVTQWACFQEVADVIGEEAAKFELEKVRLLHLEGCDDLELEVGRNLFNAFFWEETPQRNTFWSSIDCSKVPKEYEQKPEKCAQKPFKPTLVINDDVIRRMKATFNDNTIGSLVEKLHTSLLPSNVTISVNGNGHIIISGDKIPTVDVTKLEADKITKAYEAMVMLEGLFVE